MELAREDRPFTPDDFWALAASGALDDVHVELIDGRLVPMPPQGPMHRRLVDDLAKQLNAAIGAAGHVSTHSPFQVGGRIYEGDVLLLGGEPRDYQDRELAAGDPWLVIEVSRTSYTYDRNTKLGDYAGAGVAVYWIIDVARRQIEVFADPDPDSADYRSHTTVTTGSLAIPNTTATLDAAALFA